MPTWVGFSMASINSVEKLLELIQRSNLVTEEELAPAIAKLKAAATPEQLKDLDFVAKHFVQTGLLTRWQCDRLLEGRHRGFFLGKHKLLGHLGTGGMSAVYLAEHVKMHRRVAIKVLPQGRVDDSSYLARFYLEARAAAALDHPNIVRAYDIDNENNIHYLVMEYVEGRDLQHIVKQDGKMEFDRAANYILQAANGLEHAHEAGFVHRDIKPANLLVDLKGTVKVLDMGLAKFSDSANLGSLTVAHDENVLGTADYLAPEQAQNSHTVDSRADIYSLGCTLYFLLTGHPPFPDGTLMQRLMMHHSKIPPSIHIDRPDAPQALVDIAMRMMAKLPADRFQTAADVSDALRSWLTANPTTGGNNGGGQRSVSGGSSGRMASVARGSREAAGGGRGGAAPQSRGTGGSGLSRSRERRQIEDTVSDMDRGTIKGPGTPTPVRPKPGDSSKAGDSGKFRRALPVARPIEENQNPLDFVAEAPIARSRSDSVKGVKGKGSPSDARKPVEAKPAVVSADSKVGGSMKGIKALPPAAAVAEAAEDADVPVISSRERLRQRRKSSQTPQWMWIAVAGAMLVTLSVFGIAVYVMQKSPPPPPAASAAKAGDKSKEGQKGKGTDKNGAKSKAKDATAADAAGADAPGAAKAAPSKSEK